ILLEPDAIDPGWDLLKLDQPWTIIEQSRYAQPEDFLRGVIFIVVGSQSGLSLQGVGRPDQGAEVVARVDESGAGRRREAGHLATRFAFLFRRRSRLPGGLSLGGLCFLTLFLRLPVEQI